MQKPGHDLVEPYNNLIILLSQRVGSHPWKKQVKVIESLSKNFQCHFISLSANDLNTHKAGTVDHRENQQVQYRPILDSVVEGLNLDHRDQTIFRTIGRAQKNISQCWAGARTRGGIH